MCAIDVVKLKQAIALLPEDEWLSAEVALAVKALAQNLPGLPNARGCMVNHKRLPDYKKRESAKKPGLPADRDTGTPGSVVT